MTAFFLHLPLPLRVLIVSSFIVANIAYGVLAIFKNRCLSLQRPEPAWLKQLALVPYLAFAILLGTVWAFMPHSRARTVFGLFLMALLALNIGGYLWSERQVKNKEGL